MSFMHRDTIGARMRQIPGKTRSARLLATGNYESFLGREIFHTRTAGTWLVGVVMGRAEPLHTKSQVGC